MIRQTLSVASLAVALAATAFAHSAATSRATQSTAPTTRPRTSAPKTAPAATPQDTIPAPAPPPTGTTSAAPRPAAGQARPSAADIAQTRAVREAFDTLIDGIRRADAKAVMSVYWNSPQLILFNNNGTVTKSWEQVRRNRESIYAKAQDVKLDVRDVNVRLLGTSAAVVTCLWEQAQTADGQPERATGRLTLVFQKVGAAWRAVHAHTSPDRPDPSRLLPSELPTTTPTPAEPAAAKP